MRFKIEFSCDSAEFSDGELMFVVADVLRRNAEKLEQFRCGVDHDMAVFDINGNRIGMAGFELTAAEQA